MATSRSRHLMIVAEGRATAKSSGCLSSACCGACWLSPPNRMLAKQTFSDPLGMPAFGSKQKFCPARGPTTAAASNLEVVSLGAVPEV